MKQRVKFRRHTQVAARDYAPGAEDDFNPDVAAEIVFLQAGEILGPASEYTPIYTRDAHVKRSKNTSKNKKDDHPAA